MMLVGSLFFRHGREGGHPRHLSIRCSIPTSTSRTATVRSFQEEQGEAGGDNRLRGHDDLNGGDLALPLQSGR